VNPTGPGICEEKKTLLDSYEKAAQEHLAQLQDLRAKMATSSKVEYDRMRHSVEHTRLISEDTHIALQQHVREHGC
jgi:RNase P subunit RPR2